MPSSNNQIDHILTICTSYNISTSNYVPGDSHYFSYYNHYVPIRDIIIPGEKLETKGDR